MAQQYLLDLGSRSQRSGDGSRFWVNVVIYPVRDRAGNLTNFVKVTRDITEKLRHEQALERARNAAIQSQRMEAVG
jgi:hypothetical protein